MSRLVTLAKICEISFHEHASISPLRETNLLRRKLYTRGSSSNLGDVEFLKKIIDTNSSLRVDFGWSFESSSRFNSMLADIVDSISPKHHSGCGVLVSDVRCSWVGFMPFNEFDRQIYDGLDIQGLIDFNNDLIGFQTEIIDAVSTCDLYLKHALLRDDRYRYNYFRKLRMDPAALTEGFLYYISAVKDAASMTCIPRELLEEQIGCHFLYNPSIFFELLNFSILDGSIHE